MRCELSKSKKKHVSTSPSQTNKNSAWLAPDVDREVARIGTRFFVLIIILLTVLFGGMMVLYYFVRISNNMATIVDVISALVFYILFLAAARRSFLQLRKIGKDLLAKKQSLAAIRALEPFTRFGNRNFDSDGEAHMLLMMAYIDQNQWQRAERTLNFLERHRKRCDATIMARHVYDENLTRLKKSRPQPTEEAEAH